MKADAIVPGPPVPDPDKIVCPGLNYRQKVADLAAAVPEAPVLFAKFRNRLIGAGALIVLPAASSMVDYGASGGRRPAPDAESPACT